MQIDFYAHIEKLLFLHDSLIIPGLGGFSATLNNAKVDQLTGSMAPPFKSLSFNENLITDDGILTQEIAATYAIPVDEARKAIQGFVSELHTQLNQREIITFPGVGRIYKNYMQKIQFLPDTINFSAESYGLPQLQFSPIVRSRSVEKAEETPATSNEVQENPLSPPVHTPSIPSMPVDTNYAQKVNDGSGITKALLAVLLILGLAAAWWVWSRNKDTDTDLPSKEDTETALTDTDAEKEEPSTPKTDTEKEPLADKKEEKPEPTTTVTTRECIMIVATLQNKQNADKLVAKLEKAGFIVYFLEKRGYQVGIRFAYSEKSEIQDNLTKLRKLTGEQNIIIRQK